MKKTLLCLIATLLTLSCATLFACTKDKKTNSKTGIEKYVSCYHSGVYVGENADFTINFTTGECEKLMVIDGTVGELTNFATITATPNKSDLFNNTYSYTLIGEAGSISGDLTKDVVGSTFSAEVSEYDSIGKIISTKICSTDILESEIPLTDMLENALTWRDVVKIAECEFAENITAENDTGKITREIYVKLVNAMPESESPYYWYVAFIKSSSDYWALLLDANTGDVISKKV